MSGAVFIVNPTAGRGRTARLWPALAELLPADAEVVFTERPGHAEALARAAVGEGRPYVAAVGGDGTAAEVAAGLAGTAVPMAVVPTGAGCDIARGLGLSGDPRLALESLLDGELAVADLDAGRMDGTLFLTVAGVGFDAEVAAEDARTRRPGVTGTWPYLLAIFKVLARYRPTPLLLRLDGQEIGGRFLLVAVCNTQHYAGGMWIAPTADPQDGLLDVVAVGDLTVPETLRLLPKVYSGRHRGHPKIAFYRARTIEIESPEPIAAHRGGELAQGTPIRIEVVPSALRVLARAVVKPAP
jgi:diacylglycerol kinase (ATP)